MAGFTIAALVGTIALGIVVGLLFLQRARKPKLVAAHLVLALLAAGLVLAMVVTAPAVTAGPHWLLPLGLIGVVLALLVSGRPLGFVAILGILALIGMIAKNAVILITQISDDRAGGKSVEEAAVAAATNRMRPLLLTALSTVLGLLPIAPTLFWGPMAFAIMGGLLVATLLTLIFLPTLYVAVHGGRGARAQPADV